MSRSSYSVNGKSLPKVLGNPEPYLIIEKSLEINGQQWVENVNLIEELLVQVIQKLGKEYPQLKATFVVRRLPNFMVPFVNKNEYAIILENFDFSLVPHDPKQKPKVDRIGKPNFGQIEIFLPQRRNGDGRTCHPVHTPTAPSPASSTQSVVEKLTKSAKTEQNTPETGTMDDCNVFLNAEKAYYSHEVFKAFATAFTKAMQMVIDENGGPDSTSASNSQCHVQLIGPHLLKSLKCNSEVSKIFRLITEPSIRLSTNLKQKCKTTVNHLRSYISMSYEDTEIIIRPGLFYEHGYHRVNANLTERIPLFHRGMLTIGESLLKGCLLFPTSYETLWTLQFWPSESHIITLFHPSSMIIRLYKMYGSFCLNPAHFYETLNNNFLLGSLDDMDSLLPEDVNKLLPMDYFISSFLYELEEFSGIEDWAPRNFATRLMHLLRSAIDSFDKGFHGHYFTKINVLRGLWRNSRSESLDCSDQGEKSGLKNLESIRNSPDNVDDYKDNLPRFLETDDLEDEFGLRFDELDIHDDDNKFGRKSPPKLTSDLVYTSVNPFETFESSPKPPESTASTSKGTTKSLSKFLKRFGSRAGSEADTVRIRSPQNTVRSMADVASEFEKSIALQRARPSLFPFPIPENQDNLSSQQKLFSSGEIKPGASSQQQYENDAFEEGSTIGKDGGGVHDSIYYVILQCLKELPPPDMASDPEVVEYIEKIKKAMESQEELIMSWGKIVSEVPRPKFICPHAFTTRQIQYLARVIHVVSRCSPSTIKIVRNSKLPSWEISGDILRIVLHQMRMESQVPNIPSAHELRARRKSSSFLAPSRIIPSRPIFKSFKRDPSSSNDPCKLHDHHQNYSGTVTGDHPRQLDPEEEVQLAMEDPETAATNRLLQWLWQLRTSEIGRLSLRANKFLEELYTTSMVNSHFLEQHSEEKCFETLALRSAVAVTKIMETGKFPANVPLTAAAKKGWLWAEMILSLASWNHDKRLDMKAYVPVMNEDDDDEGVLFVAKVINTNGGGTDERTVSGITTLTKKKNPLEIEPDLDAVTLAFHSELATPIGWNDIEDPRQPGPFTVAILIFSSLGYYKLWEVIPGNLVHALVRLQKFNALQHVGNMLIHPHRKTALNEVRKLNKSTSFRIHQFENNIMSKTFKRLASIRTTKKRVAKNEVHITHCLTCEEAGCFAERKQNVSNSTIAVWTNGRELECTKL